jgi:heat shock protein HslJ
LIKAFLNKKLLTEYKVKIIKMNKKELIQFSVLIGILAACFFNSQLSVFAGGLPASERIIGVDWKWEQTLYNNNQKTAPKDSSHYTITFNPDGKLNIRADCNRAGGSYSINGEKIILRVTHSTMAMCPPDSLERKFLKDMAAATIYFFKDGYLSLDLKYDTGTMIFRR